MAGRDIQTAFVPPLPDSVTNDATGRLILSLGRSWGVMAGRLAFAFAAAMTARASEEGCLMQIVCSDPFTTPSRTVCGHSWGSIRCRGLWPCGISLVWKLPIIAYLYISITFH